MWALERTRLEFLGDGYFLSENSETVSGRSEVVWKPGWVRIIRVVVHHCGSHEWREQYFSLRVCVLVWLENVNFFFLLCFVKMDHETCWHFFCFVPQTEKKKQCIFHTLFLISMLQYICTIFQKELKKVVVELLCL